MWKKFRLEWNYNSNHIEGNTLTYQETELYLIFDQTPTNPHTGRELEEMKAHDVAVELIRQWASDPNRQLTEADIRELNKTILVRPFWKDAETSDGQKTRRQIQIGEYKQHPNHVRLPNNEIFRYAEPADVPQKMGELLEWYRTEGSNLHPIITAALLHYRFVRIHPFDDGNGRISRLLLNYHLLRNNLPPLVIKSADKQNYLFALQKADVGDLDAFCIYVAEQLLWSLDLSIKAAKGESIEEIGDWEKELALLEKSSLNPEETLELNNDLAFTRLSDSILPTIFYFIEKLLRFNKQFAKVNSTVAFRVADRYYEWPPEDPYELINKLKLQGDLVKIKEVVFSIFWKGFLKNLDDKNDIGIGVYFSFNTFQYKIEFRFSPQNFSIAKKYTDKITPQEQDLMLDKIGTFLIDKIKKNNS